MKCRCGALRKLADAGHVIVGKLRQRLATERGAAGTEDDDVACAFGQFAGGLANAGEIVGALRQAQQRQAVVGMAGAQAFERAFRPRQHGVERALAGAMGADIFFEGAIDGLLDGHGLCKFSGLSSSALARAIP